ncbi:MAG: LysM peptidoglycan-binding domain-containing protein [Treponema sp.]|jgi:molecular chaperone DnaK (HSP70)|nr:LysM peptidoglycan-binding domain-containing protein [Treponema sp.]
MGKTIGIKLADGSFYPVIESGTPSKKKLGLTTVRSDQTEVHIDLFGSDDSEMKTAEYIGTLQVDRLIPHPAGKVDVDFEISIDENDVLSAEVYEPESGSRTSKQIPQISQITTSAPASDFTIVSAELPAVSEAAETVPEEPVEEPVVDTSSELTDVPAEPETEADIPDTEVAIPVTTPDFDFDQTEQKTEPEVAEEPAAKAEAGDETVLNDDDFSFLDEPAADKTTLTAEETAPAGNDVDSELSNFDFDLQEDVTTSAETVKSAAASEEPESVENVALSDDDFSFLDEDTEIHDSALTPDTSEFYTNTALEDMSLEKPGASAKSELRKTKENNSLSELFDEVKNITPEPDFSEKSPKNSRLKLAVIICIICALLCLGIFLVLFFVLPSEVGKNGTSGSQIIETIETTVEIIETPVIPVPEVDSVRIEEQEIEESPLMIEPEPVVPAPPPQPARKDPVRYRIKWGDTLWDLAGTYYKNPWRYRYIARYNGIKDPDYIISGTYILIPPR